MSANYNFNGAIGAWIDSELHPEGAESPGSLNSNFTSMKLNNIYKTLDYLNIAWFGVDMTEPLQPTISTSNPGLQMIVSDARAQNPDIKLFATLAYTNDITKYLKEIINKPVLREAFSNNIALYLDNANMDGFDIDWESPTTDLTKAECAALLHSLRKAFGQKHFISISPASTAGLEANAINDTCDIINLQNYSGFTFPYEFVDIGIKPSLLGFGAKFESKSERDPAPYQNAYQAYSQFKDGFTVKDSQYNYHTICTWRLDSGNWNFEQGQQLLLSQYIKESPVSIPFRDGDIVCMQPTATKMSSIIIRSGDVIDSIQTENRNQESSFVIKLLQHGGDSGKENPAIMLADGLSSFSYVTGSWFGQEVVAQLTINGQSYPPTLNGNVSNPCSHRADVPPGKSIVAFNGNTRYVRLSGGGFTRVLSSIEPVFG